MLILVTPLAPGICVCQGWNLHIVAGLENAHYVRELFPGWPTQYLIPDTRYLTPGIRHRRWEYGLHVLNITGFNASSHNAYVRSLAFWEAFPEALGLQLVLWRFGLSLASSGVIYSTAQRILTCGNNVEEHVLVFQTDSFMLRPVSVPLLPLVHRSAAGRELTSSVHGAHRG